MSEQTLREIIALADEIKVKAESLLPSISIVIPGDPPEPSGNVCDAEDIQGAVDDLRPGDTLHVRSGVHYGPIEIKGKEGCAIRAIDPGTVRVSGMALGTQWGKHDALIYKAAMESSPWSGDIAGAFLFKYRSLQELRLDSVEGVRVPPYGFAHVDGMTYLRVPAGINPNGYTEILTALFGRPLIEVVDSPNATLSGLSIEGAGSAAAIQANIKSNGLVVDQCEVRHSRFMARLASDSKVTNSTYTYPHFKKWAMDVARANGNDISKVFPLVKKVFSKGGNSQLEGGLQVAIADDAPRNCEFSHNLVTGVFDGGRIGEFSESSSHHNTYDFVLDDATESESWRGDHPAKNIRIHDNLIMDCVGSAISLQDRDQIQGPVYIYNNVVIQTDAKLFHPAYLIKTMGLGKKPKIYVYNNMFHNPVGPTGWGRDVNWLWLDLDKKADVSSMTLRNNIVIMDEVTDWNQKNRPNSDWNVLVSNGDEIHIRGPNGHFIKDQIRSVNPDRVQELCERFARPGDDIPSTWPNGKKMIGPHFQAL